MLLRLVVVLVVLSVSAGCLGEPAVSAASAHQRAQKAEALLASPPGTDVTPTGRTKEFTLYLHPMSHEVYPGAPMAMWGFSFSADPATATVPGPTIRVTEGDLVRVTLLSSVAGFEHTLHWHGQLVPHEMDGVPYVTQDPVPAGQEFTYEFIAKPAGTYWYHCHVDAQHHIDMGMYGALIVDPQDPADDPRYDGEFLMIMDEMDRYHVEAGNAVGSGTPQGGDYYSTRDYAERMANDLATRNAQANEHVTGSPVRPERDWYPTTYAPYTATYNTFLINGASFPYTEPLHVDEGKTYRIRMVNAGNVIFAMHLHGHHMLVTHRDGILLESPYWVDTVTIAPGERYDVYLRANNPGVWNFHSHMGGHTQNDNIFPGGAMTMLCYAGHGECSEGGHH